MAARDPRNLVLTGLSTSGKSTCGAILAKRLGLSLIDLDEMIEREAGRSIAEIFKEDGEAAFRDLETTALKKVLAASDQVVATGGGAVIRQENRDLMREGGVVVCLAAQPSTILTRLYRQSRRPGAAVRPLLSGPNPEEKIRQLYDQRAPFYAEADWTVPTDSLSLEEVVGEVVRAWEILKPRLSADGGARGRRQPKPPQVATAAVNRATALQPAAEVRTPGGSYPVYVGAGILGQLGRLMRETGLEGRAWVLADEFAAKHYGQTVLNSLRDAGFSCDLHTIASGERSKSFDSAATLFRWLADRRAERKDPVVALGGGVVGDLAGFVAATYLRGTPLVQVPTTLLAMTDSSIGGKVAINLEEGKNLVGAFHQPKLVLADVDTLSSLPKRELVAGWAETLKHAMIQDLALLETLESHAEDLAGLRSPALLANVIGRSAAVKARVVSADEREDGLRMILNYGHTIGHALEAAGRYTALLHGEAVAIGMTGVARMAVRLSMLHPDIERRQAALLAQYGFSAVAPPLPKERVLSAMLVDKKVQGKKIRWILLEDIGRPVVRNDVPPELVAETVEGLIS